MKYELILLGDPNQVVRAFDSKEELDHFITNEAINTPILFKVRAVSDVPIRSAWST